MKFVLALAALAIAVPAAANEVTTTNQMLEEKTVTDAQGVTRVEYVAAKTVVPGTPLLIRLTYENKFAQPVEGFRLTNAVPPNMAFVETKSPGVSYSVDGGATYGDLGALKVKTADGSVRAAAPADVTHVQFALAGAIPAGGKGELSFRGVVK